MIRFSELIRIVSIIVKYLMIIYETVKLFQQLTPVRTQQHNGVSKMEKKY